MSTLDDFRNAVGDAHQLIPRDVGGKKIAQAIYKRQVATIVGVKTAASRFLPVSHAGYSNETYVDKLDLLGKSRAEFIGRKLKGTERRAHMTLFREMVERSQRKLLDKRRTEELKDKPEEEQEQLKAFAADWQSFFSSRFGKECKIPDGLCIACWNCSLFGGLEAGKGATFSRIRYFDTFSVEDAVECVQTDDSPEQMAIGNTVGEDLSVERGEASFHRYEYVKPGTRFPFITIIESPTLLDVAGYLAAVKRADQHGYGKYSANHGKFKTEFLAVSTGYPLFSVLDMLGWVEQGTMNNPREQVKFESAAGEPVSLYGTEIAEIQSQLEDQFNAYISSLNAKAEGADEQAAGRRRRSRRG
jgi:CRISPR type I-D-associated protein Csc2